MTTTDEQAADTSTPVGAIVAAAESGHPWR